jgi:GNAT superfamily N-acetyltransferase
MQAPRQPELLAQMLTLRPLTVDDLSTARYIHAAAFTRAAVEFYSPDDVAALVAFVRSPLYGDLLLGNHAITAWIGPEMVGTGAWSPGEARSPTARLISLSVRPMFTGEGIGHQLLEHIEGQVRDSGFHALEVAATLNSTGFFDSQGFRLVRHGPWALPLGHPFPVAYMRKSDFAGVPSMH